MISNHQLHKKIESFHPDMGENDRSIQVSFDRKVNAWSVDLHADRHHLKTFLEPDEARTCLEEDKCIPLALQTGQLKNNFDKYIHEHALEKDRKENH